MVTDGEITFAVRNHRLKQSHFKELCSGEGGPDVVRFLWRVERSRRLLLLNALMNVLDEEPHLVGPLPPAHAVREVLAAAEAVAPDEVNAVLMYPQIGNWLAYTLRRYRSGIDGDVPLWVDFGAIHTVVLVIAARVGLTWRTRVPVRASQVMLPTLGAVSFSGDSESAWADVVTEDGTIRLSSTDYEVVTTSVMNGDGMAWQNLRRLTVGGDLKLSLLLDDLDPFRNLASPVEPTRLDEDEVADWTQALDEAWSLLCANHRETARAMAQCVVSLVPLPQTNPGELTSASTGEAFGCVLISTPNDPVLLAAALVHEFQHAKLGVLLHLGPLTMGNDSRLFYAPWRDDPRPLVGLLQGLYAFTGIVEFWRVHRKTADGVERLRADFEYAYAQAQIADALLAVSECGTLAPWGARLVEGLGDRVQPWLHDAVHERSRRAATLLAAGHRAGWRIRHVKLEPDAIRRVLGLWLVGGEALDLGSYDTHVESDSPAGWSKHLSALVRRYVTDEPTNLMGSRLHPGEADLALMDGDVATAKAMYRDRVMMNPDDFDAWVGLGLADESCWSLLEFPTLVRALYLRLVELGHRADPVELAVWFSQAGQR